MWSHTVKSFLPPTGVLCIISKRSHNTIPYYQPKKTGGDWNKQVPDSFTVSGCFLIPFVTEAETKFLL